MAAPGKSGPLTLILSPFRGGEGEGEGESQDISFLNWGNFLLDKIFILAYFFIFAFSIRFYN